VGQRRVSGGRTGAEPESRGTEIRDMKLLRKQLVENKQLLGCLWEMGLSGLSGEQG